MENYSASAVLDFEGTQEEKNQKIVISIFEDYLRKPEASFGYFGIIGNYRSHIDKNEKYVGISDLGNIKYTLNKSIYVRIFTEKDSVVADISELELYSFGQNEAEVLKELKENIIDMYEELTVLNDERLGKYPKIWKEVLIEYVRKIR
jgi:hypothetical protein